MCLSLSSRDMMKETLHKYIQILIKEIFLTNKEWISLGASIYDLFSLESPTFILDPR